MRAVMRTSAITLTFLLWLPAAGFAASGPDDLPDDTPVPVPNPDWTDQWCRYAVHASAAAQKAAVAAGGKEQTLQKTVAVNEVEPNDIFATSQLITLGPDPVSPVDLDVRGRIQPGNDVDLYRFFATKGDVLGLAVQAETSLDPILSVQQLNEVDLVMNDDDGGVLFYFPPETPFPGGTRLLDSSLTWVCPQDGEYLIRIASFASASNGAYTLQIRARRSGPEHEEVGDRQILYLDFDGATINAVELFETGRNPATLSPLSAFLFDWGLTLEDEAEVVEAIIQVFEDTFDDLRQARLNGNRETDLTVGHFDLEIRNSRDHPDPFGDPNVSRVIIGGTIEESGISTIGIAQYIDPGNFSMNDTAVVLLDLLSLPTDDPLFPFLGGNSVNGLGIQQPLTIVDAIGAAVGKVAAHEAGHFLGLWHTDNENEVPCLIDQGGMPIGVFAGAGPDYILGTGDDEEYLFIPDEYIANEAIAVGEEEVDFRVAFGLSSGRIERDTPSGGEPGTLPLGSIRATPTAGNAPLAVQFFAGAISDNSDVTFVWDFRDGSDAATGPAVTHTFTKAGDFLVKVTASDNSDATGEATVLIRVSGLSPTAVLGATPKSGPAPLTVSFSGTASLPPAGGQITSYAWNFGDGATGSGQTVQHTYATAGTYTAKLTVTGSNSATSEASTTIVVGSQTSGSGGDGFSGLVPCALGSVPAIVGTLFGLTGLKLRRRR